MNTITNTPPVLKTLFPLDANVDLIDTLIEQGHKLFCFKEYNAIVFEGDPLSTSIIKKVLLGGVTG